ncbi:MAG: bifunctional diaminohydroxyphosphoribosylaminopyrimidine deaminase/5-amino-6-(5-phosphoribosylamino)uracil reductase RibD [Microbacteriaceae bacterium]|nr:bifunctional diaminohydroxyphosphoribosylaminopyrimidine deaminase/5-amino-6-(5-phosphoribosylamino)uracil reductase RibD [Microbacteriaceae bacterium]
MTAIAPEAAAYTAAMKRALEIAAQGPVTGPNPQVGCVLLNDAGEIVSEGWHEGSGTPHAEIMALDNLRARDLSAKGLTAVVTLEPCAHTGKTGPCAVALVEAGVSRVVYSVSDPGAISGGGAAILEQSGVQTLGGVENEAGTALIERWLVSETLQRPWVTLKWAMSLDGRSAAADGTSQWITGDETRAKVHLDRSRHDAIIVGINTVLTDNPRLTARAPEGGLYPHQPLAVVIGARDVPDNALIRNHPGGFLHAQTHDLAQTLSDLFARGTRSVYVEGGATIASAFLKARLVDELHITMGPLLLGGPATAVTDIGVTTMADAHQLNIVDVCTLGGDIVVTARPLREGSR